MNTLHPYRQSGFTLMELLVVIAIIGVLSSIVLVSVGNARDNARVAAVQATLTGLRQGAENFYISNPLVGYGDFAEATCPTAFDAGADNFLESHQDNLDALAAATNQLGTTSRCASNEIYWAVAYENLDGTGGFCIDNTELVVNEIPYAGFGVGPNSVTDMVVDSGPLNDNVIYCCKSGWTCSGHPPWW